jgi:hypothetical protein
VWRTPTGPPSRASRWSDTPPRWRRTSRWTIRRSTRSPAARRRWNRRSSWRGPTTSHVANPSGGSSSPGGVATTGTRSARWICRAASRFDAPTRRGSAASATSPPPIRTARETRARTPSAIRTSWPPSSNGPSRPPGPARSPRSWRSRSSVRRSPPPCRRTGTGPRSPKCAAGTASCSSPTRS